MKAVTKMQDRRVKLDSSELELEEKLVSLDRVTKVVKGGKHLRFRALIVVGDNKSHVGFALAKAHGVPDAARKATAMAKKRLIEVPSTSNGTIPHEILAKFGASRVLLKPAAPGTGLIASNTIRTVLELAGIRNILSKSLGSSNRVNVVKATILALTNLKQIEKAATEAEPLESSTNETE